MSEEGHYLFECDKDGIPIGGFFGVKIEGFAGNESRSHGDLEARLKELLAEGRPVGLYLLELEAMPIPSEAKVE